MITPTRTVCICVMDGKYTYQGMNRFRLTPKISQVLTDESAWDLVKQVIVREELIKKEEGPKHPWCNKTFNPMNPCDCGNCSAVLGQYSNLRHISMNGRSKLSFW